MYVCMYIYIYIIITLIVIIQLIIIIIIIDIIIIIIIHSIPYQYIKVSCALVFVPHPRRPNYSCTGFTIISRARIFTLLCSAQSLWKFCGELRRFAETVIFPCRTTNKYGGDLRRRRIHATPAQKNDKILARETPYPAWVISHSRFPEISIETLDESFTIYSDRDL